MSKPDPNYAYSNPDFIAVLIRNRKLELQVNLGDGNHTLVSRNQTNEGDWNKVDINLNDKVSSNAIIIYLAFAADYI
jgi:hypothetical protein